MKLLILFIAISISMPSALKAQTAKVEQLSKEDSEKAASTYKQLQDAQQAWTKLQTEISNKYLTVPYDDPQMGFKNEPNYISLNGMSVGSTLCYNGASVQECGGGPKTKEQKEKEAQAQIEQDKKARYTRRDWGNSLEFEFSSDFKYIVPKPLTIDNNNIRWNDGSTVGIAY